jgi:hypothetical protein
MLTNQFLKPVIQDFWGYMWTVHYLEKLTLKTLDKKLSAACYTMRSVKPLMSLESLKIVYYAYFHSIMSYGLIFWGNSSHSSNIFKIKKNIIRILTGCRRKDSCRNLFRKPTILPLQS